MDRIYVGKDVLRKVNTVKSIEELTAIAKENNIAMSDEELADIFKLLTFKGSETVNDEELDNISGGSYMRNCRTYSSDTNSKGQHPLIITRGNYCSLYEHNYYYDEDSSHTCPHCLYFDPYGIEDRNDLLTLYCKRRSDEDDPLNPR